MNVTAEAGKTVVIVSNDPLYDPATVHYLPVEGGQLSDDGKTPIIPGEGTWSFDQDGNAVFTPEPGFTGKAPQVHADYTRTDGVNPEGNSTFNVEYLKPGEKPADPSDPAKLIGPTVVPAPRSATGSSAAGEGSSDNEVLQRCIDNAAVVGGPLLLLIPVGLMLAVGAPLAQQFAGPLNQAIADVNAQIADQLPDVGSSGGQGTPEPQWATEIRGQVDAINQQFARFARENEPLMIGAGIVAAGLAVVGLIAAACAPRDAGAEGTAGSSN